MTISIQVLFFRIYLVVEIQVWWAKIGYSMSFRKNLYSENRYHFGLTKLGTISENKVVQSSMLYKKR